MIAGLKPRDPKNYRKQCRLARRSYRGGGMNRAEYIMALIRIRLWEKPNPIERLRDEHQRLYDAYMSQF